MSGMDSDGGAAAYEYQQSILRAAEAERIAQQNRAADAARHAEQMSTFASTYSPSPVYHEASESRHYVNKTEVELTRGEKIGFFIFLGGLFALLVWYFFF